MITQQGATAAYFVLSAPKMNQCMRVFGIFIFGIFCQLSGFGQGLNIDRQGRTTDLIQRLSLQYNTPVPFHLGVQPYQRADVVDYAQSLAENEQLSDQDYAHLQYIFDTNNEWLANSTDSLSHSQASTKTMVYRRSDRPILRKLYQTPATFFELNEPAFYLRIDPMVNFRLGRETDDDQALFFNQRGLAIRGGVDDKVYFYTNLIENQARFPIYVDETIQEFRRIPGFGVYKTYRSEIFDIERGYDFLNSQAYVGFNVTKHIGVQFGHDRLFIGHGLRSNLLSDFGNNYLNLRLNWQVGKVHYQNIFAELASTAGFGLGSSRIPRKFMAAHYFSIKLRENLEVGLLETTIFARDNNAFDLQYLNPVILYRTIEQFIGSPDNVLIGINGRWEPFPRLRLYGQLMLDEFKFDELILERRGWWANKFAIQAGLQTTNLFGIDQLDAQLEYNVARPYTYTHRDTPLPLSYSHYNQPLAHPLGANFSEIIGVVRYQPHERWLLEFRSFRMQQGLPENGENVGSDILESYTTRTSDFDNTLLQGNKVTNWMNTLEVSYALRTNLWLDLDLAYRMTDEEIGTTPNRSLFNVGVRWNTWRYRSDF